MTAPQHAALTLSRLEQFRLDKLWSYERLASEIQTVTGAKIHQSTLNRAVEVGRASRLTLHVLDKFLDVQTTAEAQ